MSTTIVNVEPDCLRIVVARGLRLAVIVDLLGLVVWCWLGAQAWLILGKSTEGLSATTAPDFLLLALLVVFLALGADVLYGVAFSVLGQEILVVHGNRLQVYRGVWGLGVSRACPVECLRDLRVLDLSRGPFVQGIAYGPSRNGRVELTCGEQVIRFGDSLSTQDAKAIVETLQDYLRDR